MKKIDTGKYISICLSAIALVLLFTGFQVIAGLLAAVAILVPITTPHKSGNLFIFAFFFSALAIGFAIDHPFEKIPAALISFLLVAFIFNFRTFFYRQMLVSGAPWFEMAATIPVLILFALFAFLLEYDLRQWLMAAPLLFFGISTPFMYKDRKGVKVILQEKKLEMKVGIQAPDFTLPDQFGNPVTLSELLQKSHVLLIFVRGDWCPTCHVMLRSYFRNKELFAERNVRIVGIGPDPQGVNKEIMQRIDEDSILLSDPHQKTALLYASDLQPTSIINKNSVEEGIPLPASFLVHRDGRIAHTTRSDKPGEILYPELIFRVLETFTA